MHRAYIMELDGRRCVVVKGGERPQVYVCVDEAHAQKWLQLMDTPERERRAAAALKAPSAA